MAPVSQEVAAQMVVIQGEVNKHKSLGLLAGCPEEDRRTEQIVLRGSKFGDIRALGLGQRQ